MAIEEQEGTWLDVLLQFFIILTIDNLFTIRYNTGMHTVLPVSSKNVPLTPRQNGALYALVRQYTGLSFSGEHLQWLAENYDTDRDQFKKITTQRASEIIGDLKHKLNEQARLADIYPPG